MTSCTGRRRPLHLQKTHAHRPKCHLTHYLPGNGKRHTWWDDTKCLVKLGSCWSESICTQLTRMTEMTRQDSMICACHLRSGTSDGQLVVHRQISTDPHRTLFQVAHISSASKAFQRILATPPSDFADASVIVKLPPDWVKLPFSM